MSTLIHAIDNADEQKAIALDMLCNMLHSKRNAHAAKLALVADIADSITAKAKALCATFKSDTERCKTYRDAIDCMRVLPSERSDGVFKVEIADVADGDVYDACTTLEKWARNVLSRDVKRALSARGIVVEGFRAAKKVAAKFDAAKTVARLRANHSAAELRAIKALL
jgi:hypothetical protein